MEKVTLEVAAESPERHSPVHTECQESAMEEFSPDEDDLIVTMSHAPATVRKDMSYR